MTSKIFLRATCAALLLAAMPLTATAVSSTTTTDQRLTNLRTKGAAELDRRISNLNSALDKLSASTKLTAVDKSALTQQVQDEVTGLTTLKAKLAADTTLTAARADVKSIVTDYRVYALLLPKTRMVASADRFAVAEEKLTDLHNKLQAKVSATKQDPAAGITATQAKLDDMANKIAAAKAVSDSMVAKLLALKPTDYNANHTVLAGYRDSLRTAQTDLKAARDDAKFVMTQLQAGNK